MKVGNGALQSFIMQDKVPVKKQENHTSNKKNEENVMDPGVGKTKVTNEDLIKAVEEMNKALDMLNKDLKFNIHEETDRVMVKVVDPKSQEVLKEFPAEEMLDVLANIKKSVGIILDKYV